MKRAISLAMSVILPALLFVNLSAQVSFTNYTSADGLVDDYVIGGVCIDQSNTKWFGTQSGLSKFDGTIWTTYTTSDGLVDNYITCIASDNDYGWIWVGTNSGVSLYDGESFINYTTTDGLVDNSIINICVGDAGIAWVATYSGLIKIDDGLITNYSTEDGLSSTLITYLHYENDILYIGTLNAGLMIYDGSTFETVGMAEGLVDNYVSAIEVDDSGNIYVGSYAGLTVLDASLNVTNTYGVDVELFNEYVQDIVVDQNGNLIVLEYADYLADGGVTIFDGTSWVTYSTTDGLVDVMVKRADMDNEGNIWITTGAGVSMISVESGISINYINAKTNVYPNPANGFIKISNIKGLYSYKITDLNGRVVLSSDYADEETVDISSLSKSVYVLSYENDGKFYSTKIVIE